MSESRPYPETDAHLRQIAKMRTLIRELLDNQKAARSASPQEKSEIAEDQAEIFEEMLELNKQMPYGVHEGKICSWNARDARAWYVIVRVLPSSCKLLSLPVEKGYTWLGVNPRGFCAMPTVESAVRFAENEIRYITSQ